MQEDYQRKLYPCYFKMLCQAQGRRPEQDAT